LSPNVSVTGRIGIPSSVGGAEGADVGSGQAVELTNAARVIDGAVTLQNNKSGSGNGSIEVRLI
jgi:hypothetical protein